MAGSRPATRGVQPFTTYDLLFTDSARQTLTVICAFALALAFRQDSPDMLLHRMQDAVKSGSEAQVATLFDQSNGDDYLLRMAKRCGGLQGLKVAVFPTPKGWESTGKYWAMFHTWQELEQDHDPIYRVVQTPQGLRLGAEIPEWDCGGKPISDEIAVSIDANAGSCMVQSDVRYQRDGARSLLLRLNDKYVMDKGRLDGVSPIRFLAFTPYDESKVAEPGILTNFRVGGLVVLAPFDHHDPGHFNFIYHATIGSGSKHSDDRDQITATYAYLTSFWVPSLGRLPAPTKVHIYAPKDWEVRSEGETYSDSGIYRFATGAPRSYKCDIPIAYPKVCAGKYVIANEATVDGHLLRTYQFAPIDKKRADETLDWMKKAIVFYDKNLGEFPFKEYDCFDGKDYYGIESYSYTILAPNITTWAVSHEMGHTYFGGLVPCPYVKDSWNEGMTQYVDDVLLHNNADEVNRNALHGLDVHVPLTQMPVAWEYNGATYWRGAYAMEMLDAEIGHDKVLTALRAMIKDRQGKDTTWTDLRPYFEKSSGKDLKWFWDQWITGDTFPHVKITSAITRQEAGKWITRVIVEQEGTASPLRLRFAVRVSSETPNELPVLMTQSQQTYEVTTNFQPKQASINPATTALVTVDAPVAVTAGD